MADYLYVRKTTSSTNEGFYQDGTTAFTREALGVWKVAYKHSDDCNIRMGVYRNANIYHFVFVSSGILRGLDLRMVSPTFVSVGTVQKIDVSIGNGYEGYYNTFGFTPDAPIFAYTVFTSLQDCLTALSYGSTPSPSSGVVVTAIASPVETPPTTEGVIVYAIARLLDPNQQGGTSETGGGQGTFDETSDPIPIPALPSISAAQTGLVALFKPSLEDLRALGSYLWTNLTDFIENLNKLFMNPMDYLIALNIFPCNPDVGARRVINIGSFTTSIDMPPVLNQWYELNCGDVIVPEYWGSALDYAPNTKISLFLPFIGSIPLNTDEIMGRRVGITYRIDLLSGQCVAMVTVNGLVNQTNTESVIYQFTGECAVSVPLTGADWSRIYSAGIGAVGTAITGGIAAGAAGAAAGGATSALAGAQAADAAANAGLAYSMINDTSKGVKGVTAMREQMLQASQMAMNAGKQAASQPARVARGVRASRISNTVNNVVGNVMTAKGSVNHSGTISGSAGMLGVKVPYLLIEYPNQSLADNYKHFVGYPSNMHSKLGTLSGYTECEQVIPTGLVNQTDSEVAELLESLKGGVYLNFNSITTKGTGITLYNYTTTPNTVGKGATIVETLSGTFRDTVSIIDPVFTLKRSSPVGFNYVYIEAFNRFYYVNGVSADLHGLITVSCTVDPLETNAAAIQQMDAIIKRQENKFNLYLDDGIFKAYQNTKHKIIKLPYGFTEYSYILALAGNGSEGN